MLLSPGVAQEANTPRTPVSLSSWTEGSGFRWRPVTIASGPRPQGFTRLSANDTGIHFTNQLAEARYVANQILLNGSGVAAGDVDGDGRVDVFFAGLDGGNRLYRNLGNWHFEDITASSGVAGAGWDATGVAFADLDGDGDLDLVVNTVGRGTRILLNDGKAHFKEFTLPDGPLNPARAGMSLALADLDGDGDLDLYVANYRTVTIRDQPDIKIQGEYVNGKPVVARINGRPASDPDLAGRLTLEPGGKIRENGEVDVLFINEGNGRFTPQSFTGGRFEDASGRPLREPPHDWGLSVMARDIDGDGLPDLYVCNDFESEDRIWMNLGQGRFRAVGGGLRHTSMFSMGIDFADVNRDGLDDFFVADMMSRSHERRHVLMGDTPMSAMPVGVYLDRPQYSHNTLFINRGGNWRFSEIAFYAGVHASDWSWAPVFLDVDLDGYEDLLITAGHQLEMMNADIIQKAEELKAARKMSPQELLRLRLMFPRFALPHVAFRNRGDSTFEDRAQDWGFADAAVSHGMALADLDGDGDLDLVINNLNSEAGVYRNDAAGGRVAVRLRGRAPNTHGIGARIQLRGGAVPEQHQELISGGRYLSSDDAMRVFATGRTSSGMSLEVRWPSGRVSTVQEVAANRCYEIDEPDSPPPTAVKPAAAASTPTLFTAAHAALSHQHFDEPYDDFQRQPLLPNKLSQLGPGVCWTDFDEDGWIDLVVATGKGGSTAAFRNDTRGRFTRVQEAPFTRTAARDQTGVVGFGRFLFAGSVNYEDGLTNGGYLAIYDLARKASGESVLGPTSSTGPVAAADIDADGDLDFFIGGRAIAGRYPEPATSLLLRNEGGRLVIAQRFEKVGLVSGAVFTDLDGDGTPELVLAMDWGSPRVFRWQNGRYEERTAELGLAGLTGWWNGVAAGDFDGDGRMDLVLSNRGLNSRTTAFPQNVRRLYFGDLDQNGTVDIVETYLENGSGRELPERNLRTARMALPFLGEQFKTFGAYAKSTVTEIYGDHLRNAGRLEAREFASVILLNRGDRFVSARLPAEAQWSAGFGLAVADFDGDGHEDVVLAQNQFALNAESTRLDGGYGLFLRGDGKGGFEAVSPGVSGIEGLGEQRGCAVADYDGDGRPDVVITQNAAPTLLFHNTGGKPGLRVRLSGPAMNPTGVGARLWFEHEGVRGPVREIHAGGGYWSQDSPVTVLATDSKAGVLHAVIPGGRELRAAIPAGAKNVVLNFDGTAQVLP